MLKQVPNVLKEKSSRFLYSQYLCDVKKQSATNVIKTTFVTCLAEWLTWETSTKYLEVWDFFFVDKSYVPSKIPIVIQEECRTYCAKIFSVGLPCGLIPFRCKYTFGPKVVQRQVEPTDSRK